jgi:hypothetical protein
MTLDSFWTAIFVTLALTGVLTWIVGLFAVWFYWMSNRRPEE